MSTLKPRTSSQSSPTPLFYILCIGLIGLFSLLGLWVSVEITLPTAVSMAMDNHVVLPGWITETGSIFLAIYDYWPFLFGFLCLVVIGSLVVSLFTFLPAAVRRFSLPLLFLSSSSTGVLTIYLLAISAIGLKLVCMDDHFRISVYGDTLRKFALIESANGTIDRVKAMFASNQSLKMVEVKDISSLSPADAHDRARSLIYALKDTQDVATLKQVLATSDMFRTLVISDSSWAKIVLKKAADCGAPQTSNIKDFYQWLEGTVGADGWVAVPMYDFVTLK